MYRSRSGIAALLSRRSAGSPLTPFRSGSVLNVGDAEIAVTETSSRLLELLSFLQTRRDWQGAELADRLAVSARTVRRDVERLRDLGYPVESLTGPAGGYRLRPGRRCRRCSSTTRRRSRSRSACAPPPARRSTGIEETALRALVKLEQVLPAHLRRRVQALGSATIAPAVDGPTVDPQHLTVIAAACRDNECLRFAYRSREGTESRREVEAHSIVNLGRRWYLVAWDRGREDWRTFRVDRMQRPASTGVRFGPAAAGKGTGCLRRAEPSRRAEPLRGPSHAPRLRRGDRESMSRPIGDDRGERRGHLRVPDRRRRAQLAGAADRDARRRLRGARASRARSSTCGRWRAG